jgi:SAM-dependent methyltransferase
MKRCLACQKNHANEDFICPICGQAPVQRAGFAAFAPELAAQNTGFDPALFARYAQFEAGNFWFSARNALLQTTLQKYFSAPQKILEIGCGTGFVLSALRASYPAAQLTGSDIFTEGLGRTCAVGAAGADGCDADSICGRI